MAQLQFFKAKTPFFQVRLNPTSTKIGRSEQCDVVLAEPEVSREHAIIHRIDDTHLIKKESKNALLVNGFDVESHSLQDQDRIKIGPWEMVFVENQLLAGAGQTQITQGSGDGTLVHATQNAEPKFSQLQLILRTPGHKNKVIPLAASEISVGAKPDNDIVVEDAYASGHHLKLTWQNEELWLYDLGSTNGTFLNGARVREAGLQPGMKIKVGQCELSLANKVETISSTDISSESDGSSFFGFVGKSPKMKQLYRLIQKVGPALGTVLILGESGSGKELAARAVHQLSSRATGPFVAINCGAISNELIESELFGHEKGAFTGAQRQHSGAFEQARGGTLFLDEIGELPLDLQPKLLRVLENQTFRRVGGAQELKTDVRVVAATHQDLAKRVQKKEFREDLFFRLFVLPIQLPPLRARIDDIEVLAQTFLEEFSLDEAPKKLNVKALEKLKAHKYPGNVRELRNILLRGVTLADKKRIGPEHIIFPQNHRINTDPLDGEEAGIVKLESIEKRLILRALDAYDWNKAKAAEALGIAKSTLFTKLRVYGINLEEEA